jgi:hypothetical protein
MPELPTGTVTFLFSDVEGSTELLRTLRDGYADVMADHERLLRSAFEGAGGHEINTQGDSFFVAFRKPKDAVGAALEVPARDRLPRMARRGRRCASGSGSIRVRRPWRATGTSASASIGPRGSAPRHTGVRCSSRRQPSTARGGRRAPRRARLRRPRAQEPEELRPAGAHLPATRARPSGRVPRSSCR